MNLVDYMVREVLKVERLDSTMKDLEWLKEPVNAYTVSYYYDNGKLVTTEIWLKISEDEGQIKEGYIFQR